MGKKCQEEEALLALLHSILDSAPPCNIVFISEADVRQCSSSDDIAFRDGGFTDTFQEEAVGLWCALYTVAWTSKFVCMKHVAGV